MNNNQSNKRRRQITSYQSPSPHGGSTTTSSSYNGNHDASLHQPPSKQYVNFEDIEAKNTGYDPTCFGCTHKFGKPLNPELQPAMDELWEIFITNKGKISDES